MSSDPRTEDGPAGTGDVAAPAQWEVTGGRSPAVHRASAAAGSGTVARVLTILYALVITPIATGLLAYGGSSWRQVLMAYGNVGDVLTRALESPMGMRIIVGVGLGLLLLATVVATGIASSAGLLAAGALGLVSVAISAVPSLVFPLYEHRPSALPLEVLDGFVYGLPLVLHVLIGGLGLALMMARRRPGAPLAVSLLGLLLIPVLLLLAAVLLSRGLGIGMLTAVRILSAQEPLTTLLLIVLGSILLVGAAAASRWSPYALIAPAIALVLATLVVAAPTLVPLPPSIWSSPSGQAMISFLIPGGGFAAAVVLLVHTVVLAIVRSRARTQALLRATTGPGDHDGQ